MPKYQEISSTDSSVKFNIFCDDGHTETQEYVLVDGESKTDCMERVAQHINSERLSSNVDLEKPAVINENPVMEVVEKNGKLVSEVIEEVKL